MKIPNKSVFDGLYNLPQVKRGVLWCTQCGYNIKVDMAECMAMGFPTCCGYTMTMDSPEERSKYESD